ncbi:hypothetical protein ACFHW2_25000 [Actinomadura sp. LOL_016]|uniref:hypothetical protein n=1 Tax=unclassified Actinomadura TaxID=2626254 RepID=UPI003A7FB084
MTRRRRSGTTRQIGDIIDDTLDRASDVEHDLRRAARKAVENRDDHRGGDWDDDWDDDWDWDWDDCDWDDIEEILEDLWDLGRRLRYCRDGRRGRRHPRGRDRDRDRDARSRHSGGGDQLARQLALLNRRVEDLARQTRSDARDDDRS